MYCEECGRAVRAKFCGHCGTRANDSPLANGAAPENPAEELTLADVVDGWQQEVRYDQILKFSAVRETIEQHARQAPKRLTGEQFLALADKLVPQPVSMEGLAAVTQIVLTRLGLKTDKRRDERVPAPVGEVIVRTLCSLARNGQTIRAVTQAADGCVIEAAQPSDIWSLEGDLLIAVHRSPDESDAAEVTATACINGQLFDWGKNRRSLDGLFGDLARKAA